MSKIIQGDMIYDSNEDPINWWMAMFEKLFGGDENSTQQVRKKVQRKHARRNK